MIAAVDAGGTTIAVGIVEAQGQLLSRAESPTRRMLSLALVARRGQEAGRFYRASKMTTKE
jgi:predicted NBD/HSP70 family sugar kinase